MDPSKSTVATSPGRRRRAVTWVLRAIALLLATVVIAYAGFAYEVYAYGQGSSTKSADAAVVLGAIIDRDQPSAVFRERIDQGIELLRARQVRKLILTGGTASGQEYAESFVAR